MAFTGPDINTYTIPEVQLGDTFNFWREITNTNAYKLNKLRIYDAADTASIGVTYGTDGVLTNSLPPTVTTGHTFASLVRFTSGLSANAVYASSGSTFAAGVAVAGGLTVGSLYASSGSTFGGGVWIGGGVTASAVYASSGSTFGGGVWIGGGLSASAVYASSGSTFAADLTVGLGSVGATLGVCGGIMLHSASPLRFGDADSSNWVAFRAPDTVAANLTWTLPSVDGTVGQVLCTTSRVLGWITPVLSGATGGSTQLQYKNNDGFSASSALTLTAGGLSASAVYASRGSTFAAGVAVAGGLSASGIYASTGSTFAAGVAVAGGLSASGIYASSGSTFGGGVWIGGGLTVGSLYASSGSTFAADLTVGLGSVGATLGVCGGIMLHSASPLRFGDADSSNWVAFRAPDTVAANLTWTLPSVDGAAGKVLCTNGGTLGWTASPAFPSETIGNTNQILFVCTCPNRVGVTTGLQFVDDSLIVGVNSNTHVYYYNPAVYACVVSSCCNIFVTPAHTAIPTNSCRNVLISIGGVGACCLEDWNDTVVVGYNNICCADYSCKNTIIGLGNSQRRTSIGDIVIGMSIFDLPNWAPYGVCDSCGCNNIIMGRNSMTGTTFSNNNIVVGYYEFRCYNGDSNILVGLPGAISGTDICFICGNNGVTDVVFNNGSSWNNTVNSRIGVALSGGISGSCYNNVLNGNIQYTSTMSTNPLCNIAWGTEHFGGSDNIVLGTSVMYLACNPRHNIAIGYFTGSRGQTLACNNLIGGLAGGYSRLENSNGFGIYSLHGNYGCSINAFGFGTAYVNSLIPAAIGCSNNAMGYQSSRDNISSCSNTMGFCAVTGNPVRTDCCSNHIGFNAVCSNYCSLINNVIGYCAFAAFDIGLNVDERNNAMGVVSMYERGTGIGNDNAIGARSGASWCTGCDNAAIGLCSMSDGHGNNNTAIGSCAMSTNYTSPFRYYSTVVGFEADKICTVAGGTKYCATAIGYRSCIFANNSIKLGNTASNTVITGSVINNSDCRNKTDVRPTIWGLDFINALRPVDYRWDHRSDYGDGTPDGSKKGTRFHSGLLAQEVQAAASATGEDFAGVIHWSYNGISQGPEEFGLKYDYFYAPLIRAVQELSVRTKQLEAQWR